VASLSPVVAGDINVVRSVIRPEFGSLEDGTGMNDATVVAHIWRGDIAPVELDCTVDDADSCQFTIEFGDEYGWLATAATAGPWLIEYQATFTEDEMVVTVPALWPDDIMVRDQHDPEV
jgi:hypothetical protein